MAEIQQLESVPAEPPPSEPESEPAPVSEAVTRAEPPEAHTPPRTQRSHPRMGTITVRISGGHWGYIDVDGKRIGSGGPNPKASVHLRPGLHTVRVSQGEGGRSETRRVRLRAGEDREIVFNFGSILQP